MATLTIKDLHVAIDGKEILRGVNLEIKGGEFHASWDQTERESRHYLPQSWAIQNMK
ncbi:Vegetative protein 296 [Anoxybacillus sp. BCO1]|nr:Vegetative protein 296 [Anoxybacillus sp. BCO1]